MAIAECVQHKGLIVKSLNGFGLDIHRYLMVDDNFYSIAANPTNSILISSYKGDQKDSELLYLMKFLIVKCDTVDIRKEIDDIFSLSTVYNALFG